MSLRGRWKAKIGEPIRAQLTQGLSPEKIALTVAVGLCIAVNPVVGTTTVLCFVAAWALRLNQPVIQAINWSSYALQLLLIFPFIRLGERIFRAPPETRSLERARRDGEGRPAEDGRHARRDIGHAFVAWLVAAPLLVAAIYFATLPALRRPRAATRGHGAASSADDVA